MNCISINIVLFVKELEVAMEIENNKTRPKENVPNINRNKEIHEGLMNFLSTQIQVNTIIEKNNFLKIKAQFSSKIFQMKFFLKFKILILFN